MIINILLTIIIIITTTTIIIALYYININYCLKEAKQFIKLLFIIYRITIYCLHSKEATSPDSPTSPAEKPRQARGLCYIIQCCIVLYRIIVICYLCTIAVLTIYIYIYIYVNLCLLLYCIVLYYSNILSVYSILDVLLCYVVLYIYIHT